MNRELGNPGAHKHRDAAYQQICAQIVREACDLPTLSQAANRALGHPAVCGDPALATLIRSFIAEREAALRTTHRVEHPEPEDDSQLRRAFEELGASEFPTKAQLVKAFRQYQHDFEINLAQYNEAATRYALERMQDLVRRFPVHVDAAAVEAHESQFAIVAERCHEMQRQMDDVVKQAVDAARDGDQKTASWMIRRLRAMHALTPCLLPAERFEALRAQISQAGKEQEHKEALRELISREREVAAEIKKLGGIIYRFQKIAKTTPRTAPEYKRAEKAYREAYEAVRQRDTDWLTGLLLEMETYLQDLNDPAGKAHAQLDRFIVTVRDALNQICRLIRDIQRERAETAKRNA